MSIRPTRRTYRPTTAQWRTEKRLKALEQVIARRSAASKEVAVLSSMPGVVRKEIWAHLLAYNLLRTAMAVAASEHGIAPREVSVKGAEQAVTAFAPKIEAARPGDRAPLIDALLATIAYHRVGDRPGRWEPRARKRRPKPGARLTQPRAMAKLPHNRAKWS